MILKATKLGLTYCNKWVKNETQLMVSPYDPTNGTPYVTFKVVASILVGIPVVNPNCLFYFYLFIFFFFHVFCLLCFLCNFIKCHSKLSIKQKKNVCVQLSMKVMKVVKS